MTITVLALLMLGVATTSTAPKDPFSGTWKLNQAKSHLTGQRFELSPAGRDTWKFTSGTVSWTIKADGRDTDVPGGVTALVAKSPRVWEFTNKLHGKVIGTETWTLSADGNTITEVDNGTRANGSPVHGTAREKRVAGSTGFAGTWETTEMKSSAPGSLEISATKSTLELRTDEGTTLKCAYDGKAVEEAGPRATPGLTISCARPGERALRLTGRYKGQDVFTMDWSLSADGKTLTSTEHDPGQSQAQIEVYERR